MAAWRAITVSDQDGLTSVCSVPAPRAQAAWAHRLDQRGMTQARAGDDGRAVTPGPLSASVLADRMASALLHHEPGWRLPRHTALARRYNVTVAEIDTAIDLLAQRHLLTRLPDGQVFRASPAEYRVALEGLPGFVTSVDPMGGQLACKSRHVARRRAAEEVARALGAPPGRELLTVRCLWAVGGEPAAYSASYLPAEMEELATELAAAASPAGAAPGHSRPGAVQIDFQAPVPSVARSLRLSAGEPAVTVTIRLEDTTRPGVSALTVTVLRPELFRIVMESPGVTARAPGLGRPPGGWTRVLADWEP
jgi:DNA-binding GntR family transcriptional regulator